ncbi:MAG: hypothetical protein AAF627_15660 [Myxococcota bacterium]
MLIGAALCFFTLGAPERDVDALRRSDLVDEGWVLRRWLDLPPDRVGIVERRGARDRLRVLVADGRRWRLRAVAEAEGELRSVEAAALGNSNDLVLFRRRRTPDELVEHVQVLGFDEQGRGRVTWEEPFVIPDAAHKLDLRLGPTTSEVFVERPEGERARIVWRRGPRVLKLSGRSGPISVSVGAERTVYEWRTEGRVGAIRGREDYVDFLKPFSPVWVEGLEAEAGDGPSAAVVVDADLDTGWSMPDDGSRRLTLHFEETVSVQMIRLVPGCGGGDQGFREAPAARTVAVSIGGAYDAILERESDLPPGIAGWGTFPLSSRRGGTQWLLFPNKPRRAGWVRFEFLGTGGGCIAELSVH